MLAMEQGYPNRRQRDAPIEGDHEQAGRYVYCIVPTCEEISLGPVGIGNSTVYGVAHGDLCALIHDCPPQPYQSGDLDVVTSWVLAHHGVVDSAWRRWGTVVPTTFNTIIEGEHGDAGDNLVAWLATEHESLKGRLEVLAGKAEYAVQVFWDIQRIARSVARDSAEARELEQEIASKPRGLAYMYRQQLEKLLRKAIEAKAAEEFKDLYARLSRCADSIHVERTRSAGEGRQMLISVSCLASADQWTDLEAELDEIGNAEGQFVRVVGPLPPYSFC